MAAAVNTAAPKTATINITLRRDKGLITCFSFQNNQPSAPRARRHRRERTQPFFYAQDLVWVQRPRH
jgi:hypothetical protein